MATDTDNKPASTEPVASETGSSAAAKVGDGGKINATRKLRLSLPKRFRFKGVKHKGRTVLYLLIAVVVIIGGWLILNHVFKIGQKVYAQADGHKIYKQEVDDLIDNTKGVSVHQAASVLADKYLYQTMAKQAGITVTNKEVVSQYPNINAKTTTRIVRQSQINSIYFSQLSAYNTGLYKGEVLAANFNRYIPFQSSLLKEREAENPLIGNKQAINKDKQYAKNFINKLYNEVKDRKITFDQAIQMEHNDPQVGINAYQSLPHSGPFDTSNVFLGGTALVEPQSAQQELAGMKIGQLSKPFAVKVSDSLTNTSDTVAAYYLVVRMDYSRSSHSGLSFDQYLTKEKKQYDYKVNI